MARQFSTVVILPRNLEEAIPYAEGAEHFVHLRQTGKRRHDSPTHCPSTRRRRLKPGRIYHQHPPKMPKANPPRECSRHKTGRNSTGAHGRPARNPIAAPPLSSLSDNRSQVIMHAPIKPPRAPKVSDVENPATVVTKYKHWYSIQRACPAAVGQLFPAKTFTPALEWAFFEDLRAEGL